MLQNEIGSAAGVIWRYLDQNGPSPVARVRKDVPLSPGMVERAVGWLAREEKIIEEKNGRGTVLRVR